MKPKRLPRLWCAMQGLLPFSVGLPAQRAELAWPPGQPASPPSPAPRRIRVAAAKPSVNVRPRGFV